MIDFGYLIFIAPFFVLGLLASMLTKSTFNKYSRIGSRRGLTGAEAAYEMLRREGVTDCRIERVGGFLSDHYDPSHRTLRLSPDVYDGRSLSAIGVACHEAGHAIQHARGYGLLALRSMLVPVTQICSSLWMWVVIAGMLMGSLGLAQIGAWMLLAAAVFAIVTLPVEWDASRRAKVAMVNHQFLTYEENQLAAKVLNAAFLTYLAGAVTAVATFLYYAWRFGLFGRSSD